MKCKCGRDDLEFMGLYKVTGDAWVFTCCLCSCGVDEQSIEAEVIFGLGRGRNPIGFGFLNYDLP